MRHLKSLVLAGLLAATVVTPTEAQQTFYRAFEQITVANTAIGLTATNVRATGGHPSASWATCRLRTAQVSYRIDGGTPTATVGTLLQVDDVLELDEPQDLVNFRAIRTGATSGQLDCHLGN